MPAMTPAEIPALFAKLLNSGDLEGLSAMYEPDAVLAGNPEPARGIAQIRAGLEGMVASKPTIHFGNTTVLQSGDLALLHSTWTLSGSGPDGPVEMSGMTSEVVRRQADGSWKYILDDPFSQVP